MKSATLRLIEAAERTDDERLQELATMARLEQMPPREPRVIPDPLHAGRRFLRYAP